MNKDKHPLTGLERITDIRTSRDNHHYIVLSQLNSWVINKALPFARGVLLDYGCGGQPYRKVFSPHVDRYIGADVAVAARVALDIEFQAGQPVPLPDGSVDTILSTQVLEHVRDFSAYLADCHRLLGPNGRLIISVPMHWRHHEVPYDYWRFTYYGFKQALQDAGFVPLDMSPCGGVYSLIGQIFLDHLSEKRRLRGWITRLVNRLALSLDRCFPDFDDTLGWMCLAEKSK